MKKFLLFLVLMALSLSMSAQRLATDTGLRGDVNEDGIVDGSDINMLIDIVLGKYVAQTESFTVNGVTFTMVRVEAGTFTMGATAEQGSDSWSNEKPAHQVTLTQDYYIGQTEVTQELWQAVMGSNPSNYKGDNRPVEMVSWNACQEFITKLNALTGRTFRLPTEAEWEFAARGGSFSKSYKYAGSDDIGDVAWYGYNSNDMTHYVATKSPNELGLYDMSGNVYEWCQDWYGSYSSSAQTDPTGPESSSNRVVYRGGSYDNNAKCSRVSFRNHYKVDGAVSDLGLRLVLQ